MSEHDDRLLLPTATGARTRTAVLRLLKTHRGLALAAMTVMVAATGFGLLMAPLLGSIVDVVAAQRSAEALSWPIAGLAMAALAWGVTTAIGLILISRLGEQALADLREQFMDSALRLEQDVVERAGTGDLTARVSADANLVAEAVRHALPQLVRSALMIVLTLGALAVLDWRFLVAILPAAPVQIITARWYVRHAVPLYAAQRITAGALQQQLLGSIEAVPTVRALAVHDQHQHQVEERSSAAVSLTLRGIRLAVGFYTRLHIGEYIGLAGVLIVGFMLVDSGVASIGMATAAALYFHNLFGPINATLILLDDVQSAKAGLSRMVGVADLGENAPPAAAPAPGGTPTKVRLDKVGYAYHEDNPVLTDVDLTVEPGEKVAIVGASGAGKSTLAKLVAGIHQPGAGLVSHGDGDQPTSVVLVTQEVHVFAGSVAADLRLAAATATEERLWTALDRVGARDWVRRLPDGLDTIVGEGGHRLTATQAQQLALARLVLADPAVAVLDEATAEAGSIGARALEQAAGNALAGRTALIVAHRLTQAAASDRIIVLDSGQVVESGTHAQLVSADGNYAQLWKAWQHHRSDA